MARASLRRGISSGALVKVAAGLLLAIAIVAIVVSFANQIILKTAPAMLTKALAPLMPGG